jgi:hypothetical protein
MDTMGLKVMGEYDIKIPWVSGFRVNMTYGDTMGLR